MISVDSTLNFSSSFFPFQAVGKSLVIIIQRDIIHHFKSFKLLDEYT